MDDAKTTEQNLLKLQAGRIAGYAAQDVTVDYHVESGQYGEIVKLPIPLATKDYFVIFSHRFMAEHPDIAEQLWTKIGGIRDSMIEELAPKYQQIIPGALNAILSGFQILADCPHGGCVQEMVVFPIFFTAYPIDIVQVF